MSSRRRRARTSSNNVDSLSTAHRHNRTTKEPTRESCTSPMTQTPISDHPMVLQCSRDQKIIQQDVRPVQSSAPKNEFKLEQVKHLLQQHKLRECGLISAIADAGIMAQLGDDPAARFHPGPSDRRAAEARAGSARQREGSNNGTRCGGVLDARGICRGMVGSGREARQGRHCRMSIGSICRSNATACMNSFENVDPSEVSSL